MNTPAHILIGWAAFGRRGTAKLALAAAIGGFAPDLSLYLLAGVSIFVLGISPQVVFDELYFSSAWQTVFAIDNSFIVWGLLLGLAAYRNSAVGIALCGAALLHLLFDFPLHHDDGRAHFWPLSTWIYESPVSYWDRHHHANFVAPIAAALAALSGYLIVKDGVWRWQSLLVAALVAMEVYGAAFLFGATFDLG